MGSLTEPGSQVALMRTCRRVYHILAAKFYEEQLDGEQFDEEPEYGDEEYEKWRDDHNRRNFLLRYTSFKGYDSLLRSALNRHPASVNAPYEGHCTWASGGVECTYAEGTRGFTPLHSAAMAQNLDTLQILLAHSADPTIADARDRTPLHFAVDDEVIRLLLAAGAPPLQEDTFVCGWMSPLGAFLAGPARRKADGTRPHRSPAALRRLIDACRNADPEWSLDRWAGSSCMTPLEMAVEEDDLELVRAILEAGADPNAGSVTEGAYAAPPVVIHLTAGGYWYRPWPRAYTAFHRAARLRGKRSLDTMKVLVQHGARVDDMVDRQTALMHAVRNEDYDREAVRWLVEDCGADVNTAANRVLCLWPFWNSYSRREAMKRRAFLRRLVDNGADFSVGMRRTYYYVHHGSPNTTSGNRKRKQPIWALRVRQQNFRQQHRPESEPCCEMMGVHYEPATGRDVYHDASTEDADLQKARIAERWDVVGSLRTYRQYKNWTLLDEVMISDHPGCLEVILELADPLSKLTHSSQMRNTALGKLIRAVHFGYTKREVLGPWTEFQWTKAEMFLRAYGPRATAKYPVGLLAQGLAQSVARLGGARRQETRIRQYARLTNYEGRWGADGISGLEALVTHPAYWYFHARKPHLGGYRAEGEPLGMIDDNLVGAAGVVYQLSKKSSRPPAVEEPHTPWWTTRFWEQRSGRKRYQPLSDTEYHTAFAVLFGVEPEASPRYRRRKHRGRKSAKSGGTSS